MPICIDSKSIKFEFNHLKNVLRIKHIKPIVIIMVSIEVNYLKRHSQKLISRFLLPLTEFPCWISLLIDLNYSWKPSMTEEYNIRFMIHNSYRSLISSQFLFASHCVNYKYTRNANGYIAIIVYLWFDNEKMNETMIIRIAQFIIMFRISILPFVWKLWQISSSSSTPANHCKAASS